MDTLTFERELPLLFDDMFRSVHPKDRRLARLCCQVPGMATENKLMLLNFAASLLEPGEVYLDVGTWKGLSILGAMLGNADKEFYAVDNFSEFGGTIEEFQRNLGACGARDQVRFVAGDCFSLLRSARPFPGRRVGAYFYDGSHSCLAQFRALRYVERHLADKALIITDDTAWLHVRAATWGFVRLHPRFRLMFDIPSRYNGEPRWWNGVQVYEYLRDRRRAGSPAARSAPSP